MTREEVGIACVLEEILFSLGSTCEWICTGVGTAGGCFGSVDSLALLIGTSSGTVLGREAVWSSSAGNSGSLVC